MLKLFKFLGILVLVLVVVVVGAAVIIPMVVNPNDFKATITEKAKEATGRDLVIDGDIGLSVFPWVGLTLGKTRISESPAFGGGQFASMDSVEIRAKLMPLLSKKLEMDTLKLQGLKANLIRNEQGEGNWESLAAGGKKEEKDDEDGHEKALALTIGGVEITDSLIRFEDRQAGQTVQIDQLALVTGSVTPGEPVDVDLGFNIDLAEPKLAGKFSLQSKVYAAPDGKQIRLEGANISYEGSVDGMGIQSTQLNFTSDVEFDLEKQVLDLPALKLNLQAAAADGDKAGFGQAKVDLDGAVQANLANQGVTISGLKLAVQANSDGLTAPAWKDVDLKLNGDFDLAGGQSEPAIMKGLDLIVDANGPGDTFKTANVALKTGEMKFDPASGLLVAPGLDIQVKATGDGQSFEKLDTDLKSSGLSFDVNKQVLTLPGLKIKTTAEAKSLPKGVISSDVSANLHADLGKALISLNKLAVQAMGVKISGNVKASGAGTEAQKVSGNVQVHPFNLRKLLTDIGQEVPLTADPKVLTNVSFSTHFSTLKEGVDLQKVSAKLDDSNLSGYVKVFRFDGPVANFDLALNKIDADRYLPPKAKQSAGAPKGQGGAPGGGAKGGGGGAGAGKAGDQPIVLPLDLLRAMEVKGRFRVGQFKINNLRSTEASIHLKTKGGLIEVAPFKAKLYQGTAEVTKTLDVRSDVIKVKVKSVLKNFQVAPFLKDLEGKPSKLSGRTYLGAALTTSGKTTNQMKAGLNGKVSFELANGAIKGFNLAHAVRQARAAFEGKSIKSASKEEKTDFTKLTGSAHIKNGVAENNDLSAKTPLLRIAGAGKADLVKETANYKLKGTVVNTSSGQGGKELQDLKGLTIPINIRGPWAKPDIGVDIDDLLKGLLKKRAKEKIEKVKKQAQKKVEKKIEEKLKGAVGDKLKGLFGR